MLSKKVVLISILVVLLLNSASAQYYYDRSFDSGFLPFGGGFGGFDDILYIYELNAGWFDFFIFLLIFLGLTQAVFERSHLRSQSKTLSIGISLLLSFAIVAWERINGTNLLSFGPVALLIFILLLFFVVFSMLQRMEAGFLTSVAWAYVIAFAALMAFGQTFLLNWAVRFAGGLFQLLYMLFWVAILIGIIGLIGGRGTPAPQRPAGGQ